MDGSRINRAGCILLTVLSLLAVAGCGVLGGGGRSYSAVFRTATGVYPQSDVRVLGVPVGSIDEVVPQGDSVLVKFHVDDEIQVPADAKAVVVVSTVVADRYIQLTPAYVDGPVLAEGAVIPLERTASPAEFDDLLAAAQKLSQSLGPAGANANGALSQALTTAARNLQGNGQQLNTTLDNTSQALTTLAGGREDLAGTIRNLQSFATNLKQDDPQVREFTRQFAEVNGFLAGERENLGDTLRELSEALGDVAGFVRDNRVAIDENVEQLSDVLETVNNERVALEQVLETAPFGLNGLVNGYNAGSATLDTRVDLAGLLLCGISNTLGPLRPVFLGLVVAGVPGFIPATCDSTGEGAGASSLPLSPQARAQLAEPRIAAALEALVRQRALQPTGQVPGRIPAQQAPGQIPGQAPVQTPGQAPVQQAPPAPPAADADDEPSPLGRILGGGR
ncbi:MAG: MCE family protein [Pseudonocardia sp.]